MSSFLDSLNVFTGQDQSREVRAMAWVAVISAVTGKAPVINRLPDYTEIRLNPSQEKALTAFFERQLAKEPSDVRINLTPVFTPIVLKKAAPYAAGLAALSYWGGTRMKRRK